MFTTPLYDATLLVGVAFYYFLILKLNSGLFAISSALSMYLMYILIFVAANLLAISAYQLVDTISHHIAGISEGAASVVSALLGGVVIGCACQAPIIAGILYAFGFGTLFVSTITASANTFQIPILTILIVLNVLFFYYSLSKISNHSSKRFKLRKRKQ